MYEIRVYKHVRGNKHRVAKVKHPRIGFFAWMRLWFVNRKQFNVLG